MTVPKSMKNVAKRYLALLVSICMMLMSCMVINAADSDESVMQKAGDGVLQIQMVYVEKGGKECYRVFSRGFLE